MPHPSGTTVDNPPIPEAPTRLINTRGETSTLEHFPRNALSAYNNPCALDPPAERGTCRRGPKAVVRSTAEKGHEQNHEILQTSHEKVNYAGMEVRLAYLSMNKPDMVGHDSSAPVQPHTTRNIMTVMTTPTSYFILICASYLFCVLVIFLVVYICVLSLYS